MPNITHDQVSFRSCTINGRDIKTSVKSIYVGSSILTPYHVAAIEIQDTTGIQDSLYEAGLPVKLVYSAGNRGALREYDLMTAGNMGGTTMPAGRAGQSTIVAVSRGYFNLQNEHTSYHRNVTAAAAFRKIHEEMDSSSSVSVSNTRGLIGEQEPYHLRGMKLGRALSSVRLRMTSEQYNSASFVYYLDQDGNYFCVPIEQLFENADGPLFRREAPQRSVFEQEAMSRTILSMRRGSPNTGEGTDNATLYQSARTQRQGNPQTGFDFASMTHRSEQPQNISLNRNTPGSVSFAQPASQSAGSVTHFFGRDTLQRSEDFEGDLANRNVMLSLITQGSTLINVPLSGGIDCKVGQGCNIEVSNEGGTFAGRNSRSGGKHLILAQADYLTFGRNTFTGISAIHASSGGRQEGYS